MGPCSPSGIWIKSSEPGRHNSLLPVYTAYVGTWSKTYYTRKRPQPLQIYVPSPLFSHLLISHHWPTHHGKRDGRFVLQYGMICILILLNKRNEDSCTHKPVTGKRQGQGRAGCVRVSSMPPVYRHMTCWSVGHYTFVMSDKYVGNGWNKSASPFPNPNFNQKRTNCPVKQNHFFYLHHVLIKTAGCQHHHIIKTNLKILNSWSWLCSQTLPLIVKHHWQQCLPS